MRRWPKVPTTEVPTTEVPTTDDEVHKALVTEKHNYGQLAAWGIYLVKRKQGLSVDDAYMETLDHIIDIAEGRL